jgi:hypothetical protein
MKEGEGSVGIGVGGRFSDYGCAGHGGPIEGGPINIIHHRYNNGCNEGCGSEREQFELKLKPAKCNRSQVEMELDNMGLAIERLANNIQILTDKLQPVLKESAGLKGPEDDKKATLVPLAMKIRDFSMKLYSIENALAYVLDRIEI